MSIYVNQQPQFCIYLTIYSGTKLPPFYIGSTSIVKIKNGYHGSISSKKYGKIWRQELKENPHLFRTIILYKFYSRKNALFNERLLQVQFNVVKSDQFTNMSIANHNGMFGMDVSGKNNPNYNNPSNYKTSIKTSQLMKIERENRIWVNKGEFSQHINKNEIQTYINNGYSINKRKFNISEEGSKVHAQTSREISTIKCSCIFCKEKYTSRNLKSHQQFCENNPEKMDYNLISCILCKKVYNQFSFYRNYMLCEKKLNSTEMPVKKHKIKYSCVECKKEFSVVNISRHLKTHK